MDLALLYQSSTEPVTLTQAKDFLAVDHDEHDTMIQALITAARQRAENYCNRSFVEKRYMLAVDSFPARSRLKLPRGPVQSIVAVKYWDGTEDQTLATEKYEIDQFSDPAFIHFTEPVSVASKLNALKIQYVTGYDIDDADNEENTDPAYPFPEPVRTAIKMIVRTMYDHRDDFVVGAAVNSIPKTSEYILNDYRIFEFL